MNWFTQLLRPNKKEEASFEETVRGMNQSLLTVLAPDNIKEYDSYVRVGAIYTRSLLIVDYDPVQDQNKIQQVT